MYFLTFLTVGALALRASAHLHYDSRRDIILAQRRPEPNSTEHTSTLTHTTLTHTTTSDTTVAPSPCTETIISTSGRPAPQIHGPTTCAFTTTVILPAVGSKTPATTSDQPTTKSTPSLTPSSPSQSTTTSTPLEHTHHEHTTPSSSPSASTHNSTFQSYASAPPQGLTVQPSESTLDVGKILDLPTSPSPPTTTAPSSPSGAFPIIIPTSEYDPPPIYFQPSVTVLTTLEHTPSSTPSSSLGAFPTARASFLPGVLPIDFQLSETFLTPSFSDHTPSSTPSSSAGSSPLFRTPSGADAQSVGTNTIQSIVYQVSVPGLIPSVAEQIISSSPPTTTSSTSPGAYSHYTPPQPASDPANIGAQGAETELAPGQVISRPTTLPSFLPSTLSGTTINVGGGLNTYQTSQSFPIPGLGAHQTTPSVTDQSAESFLIPGVIVHTLPPSQPTTTPSSSPSTYLQSSSQSFTNGGKGPGFQDSQNSLLPSVPQQVDAEQSLLSHSRMSPSLLPAAAPPTTQSLSTEGSGDHSVGIAITHQDGGPSLSVLVTLQPQIMTQFNTYPTPGPYYLSGQTSLSIPVPQVAQGQSIPTSLPTMTPSSSAATTITQSSGLFLSFLDATPSLSLSVPPQVAAGQNTQLSLPTTILSSLMDVLGSFTISSSENVPHVIETVQDAATVLVKTGLIPLIAVTQQTTLQSSPPSSSPGAFDFSIPLLGTESGDSLIGFMYPQTNLILSTTASPTTPTTSSTPSQQPLTTPTTSPATSCTGLGGIIGAMGGFVDCTSSEATSLFVQTTPTTTDIGIVTSPTATIGDQTGDQTTTPTSSPIVAPPSSSVVVAPPSSSVVNVPPPSSGSDSPTSTDGAVPPPSSSSTVIQTTPGDGGAASTNSVQGTSPSGAAPTNPVQGTTPGDGGAAPTNSVQTTTPGDGGTAPTNSVQATTPGDGGAAPTNSVQATTPGDGGAAPTNSVQATTPGDGGAAPTNPVQGTTPQPSGTTPPPAGASITVGDTSTEPPAAAASSTTPPPGILIGDLTASQDASSNIIIGSQTLTPGAVATISGEQVSVNSGGAIIINGATPTANETDSGSAPTSTPGPAVVVVGGTSITANSASGFVIGNQTLFPGSAITTGGEVITLPMPSSNPSTGPITAAATTTSAPIFVVGSSTFTEDSQSDLVIGTQTLTPGGVLTVDGQVISLSPTGNAVIVNGAEPSTFITETASIIPQSQITSLIIAGQTLTAGGRVTVGGDILSLAPSGTGIVVIGTVTIGGGESTATATATGKKKNAGGRITSSFVFVGLQVSFVIMVFWLH